MNDLFPAPKASASSYTAAFENFWELSGRHGNKRSAFKVFQKLSPADQQAATDAVAGYYKWWRKECKDASWLHVSTYLSQVRWEDEWQAEAAPKEVTREDAMKRDAENIKSGKPYLCTSISHSKCVALLEAGLVTKEELRKVGK